MSRIGKQPIAIPPKVKVEVKGQKVLVEGPKGKLDWELPRRTSLKVENGHIVVSRAGEDAQSKSLHGTSRALVNNMVKGVSEGFVRKLEIQGVGFKAAIQGKVLNLSLGFSHPINYNVPDDIKVTVTDNTNILVEGADKQKVGAVAADIRAYYPPEPYKGKGVRYSGEKIIRKEGKTAQSK
jgi:large subunit ribosomal protein L6